METLEIAWPAWAAAGTGMSPEDWARPTRLPGWTVKDLYAHHSGFPRALLGLAGAPTAGGPVTHVTAADLLTAFNREGGVASTMAEQVRDHAAQHARDHSVEELTDQFATVGPEAVAAARGADPERLIDYAGQAVMPFGEAMRIVALEAVVHYLDLARAIDAPVPGPLAGAPLRETAALLVAMTDPVALVERATGRSDATVFPILR